MRNPEKRDVQVETSAKIRGHEWNKDPILKEASTSEEGEEIQQDLQGTPRAETEKSGY
jgi:hypothetical protein